MSGRESILPVVVTGEGVSILSGVVDIGPVAFVFSSAAGVMFCSADVSVKPEEDTRGAPFVLAGRLRPD